MNYYHLTKIHLNLVMTNLIQKITKNYKKYKKLQKVQKITKITKNIIIIIQFQ